MKRKILAILLIISLIIVPSARNLPEAHANPLLKEAVKIVVKQAIKKETKSAVESQLIKSGVRTVEKTALERANERWFQRLAADEVASLTKAVERATPSGTPGYLKVVVGATMFATGADLAFDIYDALNAKEEVDYYTEDVNLAQKTQKGVYGYKLMFEDTGTTKGNGKVKLYRPYLLSSGGGAH